MKSDVKRMSLSRALIAGLFCGIISALLIIVFAFFYRTSTNFEKISAIGPIAIFIGTPILMAGIGWIYFLLVHYLSKGETIYKMVFAVLTIFGLLVILNLKPSGGETLLSMPHGFLFGLIAICGIAACFFIPYLAHHPRIYMTAGEMKWENK